MLRVSSSTILRFPRMRGDRPVYEFEDLHDWLVPPHARG